MKPNMRLTIEQKTGGGNFADDPPESWSTYTYNGFPGVMWFAVEPLFGREVEQAMRMESATTHKAECDFFKVAKSTMRLREDSSGRIFNVNGPPLNKQERNRKLVWQLVEVEVPAEVEGSDGS